jgi:hypothetical protein
MSGLQPVTPRTWAVGDIATAAMLNAIRDDFTFLLNVPLLLCSQSTSQSVPNAAFTPITLDTNAIDTYSGHSTTVNNTRYAAQVPGYYLLLGSINFGASTVAGPRSVAIGINGTGYVPSSQATIPGGGITYPAVTTAHLNYLAIGDYAEVIGFQSTGGAISLAQAGLRALWMHA